MTREDAEDKLGLDSEAMFCDGFDDCILGVASRFGAEDVVAYDYNKIIAKFLSEGMSLEGAVEFFEFNILGAYVGEGTPIFVRTAE